MRKSIGIHDRCTVKSRRPYFLRLVLRRRTSPLSLAALVPPGFPWLYKLFRKSSKSASLWTRKYLSVSLVFRNECQIYNILQSQNLVSCLYLYCHISSFRKDTRAMRFSLRLHVQLFRVQCPILTGIMFNSFSVHFWKSCTSRLGPLAASSCRLKTFATAGVDPARSYTERYACSL